MGGAGAGAAQRLCGESSTAFWDANIRRGPLPPRDRAVAARVGRRLLPPLRSPIMWRRASPRVFALGCGVVVWLALHHGAVVGRGLRAVLGTGARSTKNADLRLAAAHAGLLARRARARAD